MKLEHIRKFFSDRKWPVLLLSGMYFLFSLMLIFTLPDTTKSCKQYAKASKPSLKKMSMVLRRERIAPPFRKAYVNLKADFVCLLTAWFLVYLKNPSNLSTSLNCLISKFNFHIQYNYMLNCCWRI